jgi:hypothetical protein
MFNTQAVLIKKDDESKHKILSIREIWIDIYNLNTGEIDTLYIEKLRADFVVYVQKPE